MLLFARCAALRALLHVCLWQCARTFKSAKYTRLNFWALWVYVVGRVFFPSEFIVCYCFHSSTHIIWCIRLLFGVRYDAGLHNSMKTTRYDSSECREKSKSEVDNRRKINNTVVFYCMHVDCERVSTEPIPTSTGSLLPLASFYIYVYLFIGLLFSNQNKRVQLKYGRHTCLHQYRMCGI